MPVYEYVCRTCDTRFEARRPMNDAGLPIPCPGGHSDTTRVLSVFASVGRTAADSGSGPAGGPTTAGGCGVGCACAS